MLKKINSWQGNNGIFSVWTVQRLKFFLRLYPDLKVPLFFMVLLILDWLKIPNGDSPSVANSRSELKLFSCKQVTEASISNTCGKLVVISVPRQSNSQEWMKGPADLHLWDLNNCTEWKVQLTLHPSISRKLKVGCEHLVTFVQCQENVSDAERIKSGM